MANPTTDIEEEIEMEYKIWKKNSPYLYDAVLCHALSWPSMTVQWLPGKQSVEGKDYDDHKLIAGSMVSTDNENEKEMNTLQILRVRLPKPDTVLDSRKFDDETGELGGYGGSDVKIETISTINHEGHVHCARYCPQAPHMIATRSPNADIHVFDYTQHSLKPADSTVTPAYILTGLSEEGFHLNWSPTVPGRLIAGDNARTICVWDVPVSVTPKSPERIAPLLTIPNAHTSDVQSVVWHPRTADLFASVGDDGYLNVWEFSLSEGPLVPTHRVMAHAGGALTVAFSPLNDHLLATAGNDNNAKIWDTRSLKAPLHTLEQHSAPVVSLHWSPSDESFLGTCSADRRLCLWNLSKIGEEQSEEDALDGPPELAFIHGGHVSDVYDMSWNLEEDWYIASVDASGILQIWCPDNSIINGDYESEDDEEEDVE